MKNILFISFLIFYFFLNSHSFSDNRTSPLVLQKTEKKAISLPKTQTLGAPIKFDLPVPEGETFEWTVIKNENETEVKIQNSDTFIYTPTQPGIYQFYLRGYRDSIMTSEWSGETEVILEKETEARFMNKKTIKFPAPEDFYLTHCSLDGIEQKCMHKNYQILNFNQKGTYIVVLTLEPIHPEKSNFVFRKIIYKITIE